MLNIIGSLLGQAGGIVSKGQEIKQIKEQGKVDLAQAQIDLKLEEIKAKKNLAISKLQAEANKELTQSNNDSAYDLAALKAAEKSWKDEFVMLSTFMILLLHFVTPIIIIFMPDFVGIDFTPTWKALSLAPWWFEFAICGILVHTLGLKGVLRMFLNGSLNKFKKANNEIKKDNSSIFTENQNKGIPINNNDLKVSNSTGLELSGISGQLNQEEPKKETVANIMFEADIISDITAVGTLKVGMTKKYKSISGTYGKGYLPEGLYHLTNCYELKAAPGQTEAYTGKSFPWVAKLEPQFQTERTGLLIHPDGNKEGTKGCIGIAKGEDDIECYNEICRMLKNNKANHNLDYLTVLVKYS